jgi:hypothetical protein
MTGSFGGNERPKRQCASPGRISGPPKRALLVCLAVVLDPAGHVSSVWVSVCPMYDAALVVPLVDTFERDLVADLQRRDSRSNVYVVRYQECLSGGQFNDEALMPCPLGVVRQDTHYRSGSFDLQIAGLLGKRSRQDGVAASCNRGLVARAGDGRRSRRRTAAERGADETDVGQNDRNQESRPLHAAATPVGTDDGSAVLRSFLLACFWNENPE